MKKHFINNWHNYVIILSIPIIWLVFYFILQLSLEHQNERWQQFYDSSSQRMEELRNR